ncbi:MAG: hypothetical protein SGJ27_26365 [Candidatus Melainabacteria bacterium]|nr:hypothetical protein [Candidatus Melainabacteria bacterium]
MEPVISSEPKEDDEQRLPPENSTKWILIAAILCLVSMIPAVMLIKNQLDNRPSKMEALKAAEKAKTSKKKNKVTSGDVESRSTTAN